MTVIALTSGADVTVIVIMQTFRMVTTILLFPFIARKWQTSNKENMEVQPFAAATVEIQKLCNLPWPICPLVRKKQALVKVLGSIRQSPWETLSGVGQFILTITIGAMGCFLFLSLGVPAGAMVGAMFLVAIASLAGVPVSGLPEGMLNYMLVGVGIMVSGSISPEILIVLTAGELLIPVLLVTLITFMTSFGVASLIHRIVGWDYPTCFLAAAPGGFSIMTTLAIKYGHDPFRVSLLHLCRLLVLKIVIPLVFMFLI
jgi:membrane AbrB-like protein